jgi:flagellar biosynthesis protein FlhB
MLLIYFTQAATKISLVLFFKRIFTVPSFNIAANIMIVIIACWGIALFTVSNTHDTPLSFTNSSKVEALNSWKIKGFWNEKLANYSAFNETMAVLDFLLDIAVVLLPLPIVKSLRTDRKQKWSIIGIFATGSM